MHSDINPSLTWLATAFLLCCTLVLVGCGGGSTPSATTSTTTSTTTSDETETDSAALPVVESDASFRSTHFSGSRNCAECHNNLTDANDQDVSIEAGWSTSLMANSTRDPFWRAKVASEIRRNPAMKSVLDNKCSRCHAPMANVEAIYEGAPVEIFANGFLNPKSAYYNHAMDGVSCTVCHQIENNDKLGTLAGFSGEYNIVELGVAERTAFGQYSDPATNPMLMNSGFRPKHSAHMSSSAMCATCHNLKTPFIDSTGTVVSTSLETEFPEQMVYTEWENSIFASGMTAQSCQDCHMPKVDGVKISTRPISLTARNNFARHNLVGANTTMLDMLARNKAALGVTANGFADAITRTRNMLASAADIEVLSQSLENDVLSVQLRINNRSGHKLPTSYPSRRVYIHFQVKDSAGKIIFESGKTNADGSIMGADADTNLKHYEPHYDEITQPEQVQIYESIMQNTDDEVTYTLLRASSYVKDNRIPPTGFDKNAVGNDIRVVGAAMSDANFNSGSDVITYKIQLGSAIPTSFSVALKYQSLAYGFIKDLFLDDTDPEVARFAQMYNSATIRSETISEINRSVP
jgi:hypothetical protein